MCNRRSEVIVMAQRLDIPGLLPLSASVANTEFHTGRQASSRSFHTPVIDVDMFLRCQLCQVSSIFTGLCIRLDRSRQARIGRLQRVKGISGCHLTRNIALNAIGTVGALEGNFTGLAAFGSRNGEYVRMPRCITGMYTTSRITTGTGGNGIALLRTSGCIRGGRQSHMLRLGLVVCQPSSILGSQIHIRRIRNGKGAVVAGTSQGNGALLSTIAIRLFITGSNISMTGSRNSFRRCIRLLHAAAGNRTDALARARRRTGGLCSNIPLTPRMALRLQICQTVVGFITGKQLGHGICQLGIADNIIRINVAEGIGAFLTRNSNVTIRRTGRSDQIQLISMAQSFAILFTTSHTNRLFGTGGRGFLYMSLRGNLRNDFRSHLLCNRNVNLVVVVIINSNRNDMRFIIETGKGQHGVFGTGRSTDHHAKLMAEGINRTILNTGFITVFSGTNGALTVLCTRRVTSCRRIRHPIAKDMVSLRDGLSTHNLLTLSTAKGHNALAVAGGRRNHFTGSRLDMLLCTSHFFATIIVALLHTAEISSKDGMVSRYHNNAAVNASFVLLTAALTIARMRRSILMPCTAIVIVDTTTILGSIGILGGSRTNIQIILQLGRRQRNLDISCILLVKHVSYSIRTNAQIDLGTFLAGDICAIAGSIDITSIGNNGTANFNLCINQISRGAGIALAGSIRNRNYFLIATARIGERAPGIAAVCVQLHNITIVLNNIARHALSNLDDRAGGQRNVLVHADRAAHHINSHVVVNGQNIISRVQVETHTANQGSTNAQGNRCNGNIAIGLDQQTVSRAIILFGHGTAAQGEHTAGLANKRYRSTDSSTTHIQSRITVFRRTCLQGHGNFNVLNIVLLHREDAISHIRSLCTATEVSQLEELIHSTAALNVHSTGAGHKAVRIQGTAALHGNVAAIHTNEADITTGGRTICRTGIGPLILSRQTQCAFNNDLCALRDRQSTILLGGCISLNRHRRSRIQCIVLVKRNQQRYSNRNRIFRHRQCTAVHQHHILATCIRGSKRQRCFQIIKQIIHAYIIIGKRGCYQRNTI